LVVAVLPPAPFAPAAVAPEHDYDNDDYHHDIATTTTNYYTWA